jgi:hypothetical protein
MPFKEVNRHHGMTNLPTTFTRSLKRMPGCEGFWFSYRTSSSKTSFTQDNDTGLSAAITGRVLPAPRQSTTGAVLFETRPALPAFVHEQYLGGSHPSSAP